jgi:SEC-C motif-containing protein
MSSLCPCGSRKDYAVCCQPLHLGAAAASPEALMRSRYSAFVLLLPDYLQRSWHSSSRPDELDLRDSPVWKSLQVIQASEDGDKGKVHFRAIYFTHGRWGFLEEKSEFIREEGHWYYQQGSTQEGELKPGRNDPCPCGSGRKFKLCCSSTDQVFNPPPHPLTYQAL